MKRKRRFPAGAALALLAVAASCGKRGELPEQAPPAVTFARPVSEQVVEHIELTGTTASSRTVDLVARVTGYLQSVHFEDGSMVEAGQLLFQIEPESYAQQLALAEASLRRAQSEYDRQAGLLQENATSAASVERWLSERDQAKAQVEVAKLNLGYTRVTAPFSGRIGRRLVDPGNLVGPAVNTTLARLDQIAPIHVYFTLNEREALRVWEIVRKSGTDRRAARVQTPIEVGVQNEPGYPHRGTLDFVDTAVSSSSGAVAMRAVFENEDKILFPGLFARVRIPFGQPQPMLVVPASAIGSDQEGDYVLVADAADTVQRRPVVKGPLTSNGCAIRSGLAAEDRVIVAGLMRARPGSKVAPAPAAPGGPAAHKPAL
ncbi:MAG TPA: efflux RND transporter periplasmic adaptor subunit [Candidatus Paceibacterota bacterium]|nr:efflux RND transporter periplasmic adaptor subunit [Verrucomicrobiota bacterium]HOX02475.1 efflux RND transporter periplasmic adaptor subunit [Verrucomicrobiota bacterium]HRZ44909.1 efflux RND transporter periplasmic adaptor subunit [Candidatus Paceibacterota bacterium]